MAEREACVNIVASIKAELHEEHKRKTVNQKEISLIRKDTSSSVEEEEEVEDNESDEEEEQEEEEEVEDEEEEEEEVEEDEEEDDNHESESVYEDAEVIEESEVEEESVKEEEEEEAEVEEEEENDSNEEDDDNENDKTIKEEEKQIILKAKTSEIRTSQEIKKEDKKPPIKEIVKNTTKEDYQETIREGESLLLPLLQDLLNKSPSQTDHSLNKASDSGVSDVNCSLASNESSDSLTNKSIQSNQSDRDHSKVKSPGKMNNLPHHIHVEDSGTESGEDLKLIAAGLRDSIQMHSMRGNQADSNLIAEVTTALNRLEASLKEGNDLKLDHKKRNAMLSLVARLQTGLISPEKISASTPAPDQMPSEEVEASSPEDGGRRGSRGHQRFAKRRNRASRHTVGVSREELADARRYMEEMVILENLSQSTTPDSNVVTPPEFPIRKQQSAGAVLGTETQEPSMLFRPNQFVPVHLKDSSSLGNTTKSYQSESQPLVQMRDKKSKFRNLKQSMSVEQPKLDYEEDEGSQRRPLSESFSLDLSNNPQSILAARQTNGNIQQSIQNTRNTVHPNNTMNFKNQEERTVYEKNLYNQIHHSYNDNNNTVSSAPVWKSMFDRNRTNAFTTESANPENNNINRFTNKKLLMKRANTIDIPKPIKYMNEMESDSEAEERGYNSSKEVGLRGTVQVTIKNRPKKVVPEFEPKTENDHKFLAFIQKQNPTPGLGWNNPNKSRNSTVTHWSNKFGNIKNSFETGAIATTGKPPMPSSSARNFWKKSETSTSAPPFQKKVPLSPKANDKIVRPPWAERTQSNEELTAQSRRFRDQHENASMSPVHAPKPILVNKFSHAPLSAFKPITVPPMANATQFKPIDAEPRGHMNGVFKEHNPIYDGQANLSPTKSFLPFRNKSTPSPTSSLPWTSKPNSDHRVQNVATKFESKSPTNHLVRHQSLKTHPDQGYYNPEMREVRFEHKRPSLPDTSKYGNGLGYNPHFQNSQQGPPFVQQAKNFPPLPYVCTDYTQPAVSTYAPEVSSDSITNPRAEPLVLTSNRPIISPRSFNTTQQPLKIFDYPSPSESIPTSPNQTQNEITDDEFDTEPLTEYKVESKVMKGPVSQQAVTIGSRTNHVGDDSQFGKNSKAAQNLLLVMKNVGNTKPSEKSPTSNGTKPARAACISPDGTSCKAPKVDSIFSQANSQPMNRMPVNQNPIPYGGYQSSQSNGSGYSSVGFNPNTPKALYSQDQSVSDAPLHQSNPIYMPPEYQDKKPMPVNYAPQPALQEQHSYQKMHSGSVPVSSHYATHPNKVMESQTKFENSQKTSHMQSNASYSQQQKPRTELSSENATKQQQELKLQQKTSKEKSVAQEMKQSQSIKTVEQRRVNSIEESQKAVKVATQRQQKEIEQSKSVRQAELRSVESHERKYQPEQKQKYESHQEKQQFTTIQKQVMSKQTKASTSSSESQVTSQTQVYKSSAPPDTPDIVKSSLPKENIPILKKFGPPQPHLYVPGAYKGAVIKTEQTKSTTKSTVSGGLFTRKFSEPIVKTKEAPQIVETPATPSAVEKSEIPAHIVFNNVSQFMSMARRSIDSSASVTTGGKFPVPNSRPSPLSKSDSWHQIVQQQNASAKPPSPRSFNSPLEGHQLRRAKSGHTLAVPKMFEAGLDKSEIVEKQKTVAAYFSGQKSPNSLSRNSSQTNIAEASAEATKMTQSSSSTVSATQTTTVSMKKSSINRVKTSEKASIQNQNPSSGIVRSQTMPHIANINLLDESNVEDAFEQLLKGS